ncbi:MAG: hypothetical protein PF541_16855 [Prolixibacteraceae bacterium]|jgi:hypothetical protein|nr:hypothetical protein [Prolixibacteraceae bacterium]
MNILRLTGVFLLFVGFFSSCVKEVSYYEDEIPKGNIVLKNQLTQRVSEDMILEIVEIKDARCPVGVVCSSPGEVGIGFKAYVKGDFVDLEIAFNEFSKNDENCIVCDSHLIAIKDVEPYPFADGTQLDANDYRVVITVEKQ